MLKLQIIIRGELILKKLLVSCLGALALSLLAVGPAHALHCGLYNPVTHNCAMWIPDPPAGWSNCASLVYEVGKLKLFTGPNYDGWCIETSSTSNTMNLVDWNNSVKSVRNGMSHPILGYDGVNLTGTYCYFGAYSESYTGVGWENRFESIKQ